MPSSISSCPTDAAQGDGTSEARDWKTGQPIDLKPRAFAAYRDNAAIYRST